MPQYIVRRTLVHQRIEFKFVISIFNAEQLTDALVHVGKLILSLSTFLHVTKVVCVGEWQRKEFTWNLISQANDDHQSRFSIEARGNEIAICGELCTSVIRNFYLKGSRHFLKV